MYGLCMIETVLGTWPDVLMSLRPQPTEPQCKALVLLPILTHALTITASKAWHAVYCAWPRRICVAAVLFAAKEVDDVQGRGET